MSHDYEASPLNRRHAPETSAPAKPARTPDIFRITDKKALARAGSRDLVALEALKGNVPIVKELGILEVIGWGIIDSEFIHIHGETGAGKNALIESLAFHPQNWEALCEHLGAPYRPLRVFPIEMAVFETISEIYSRRAISQGQTFDEPSPLVQAIREATALADKAYAVIWLREIGRTPTASVQGGLLNLMTKGVVRLSDNEMVNAADIAWIADSNYHTDDSSSHILVAQDDAINRRWTRNLSFDYPGQEMAAEVLKFHRSQGFIPNVSDELIVKVVALGEEIRRQRREGALLSLAPPSIYGFSAFLRAAYRHQRLSPLEIAECTMLGAATPKDRQSARSIFADAFAKNMNDSNVSTRAGSI